MANTLNGASGGVIVTADGTNTLYVQTNGTNALAVDTSQNVGIGTTSPSAKLNVEGSVTINDSGADVDVRIEGDTDANLFFTDASTDRVGVGTNAPSAKFYVSGNAAQNISALTDGATITPDFAVANNFSVTLGGNRTLANPTGLVAGQSGVIFITQDGTGSRTLAYGTFWDFPNATAPTLTTTANAVDVLVYTVRSTTSIAAQLITNIG